MEDRVTANEIAEPLRPFVEAVRKALAEELLGIVVRPQQEMSHADVVVIVRSAAPQVLARLCQPLRAVWRELGVAPMIITEEEIPRAGDVFPVRFRAIQRDHIVLWGRNSFEGVQISSANLRLRTEQELRNLVLRLRRRFALGEGDAIARSLALQEAAAQLILPAGALLHLLGREVQKGESALETIDGFQGLPSGPFRALARVARGESHDDPDGLLAEVLEAVAAAADLADKIEDRT